MRPFLYRWRDVVASKHCELDSTTRHVLHVLALYMNGESQIA